MKYLMILMMALSIGCAKEYCSECRGVVESDPGQYGYASNGWEEIASESYGGICDEEDEVDDFIRATATGWTYTNAATRTRVKCSKDKD